MDPAPVSLHAFSLDASPESLGAALPVLSAEERQRATRFTDLPARSRYIACRARVRHILSELIDCSPQALNIAIDVHGKPFLIDWPDVHFNISHSDNVGILAIGDRPLGVDIERHRVFREDVAARFFHPLEREALAAASSEEYWSKFFRIWTRKESFLKALGQGLRIPLDSFSVSTEPDGERLTLARFDETAVSRFRFKAIAIGDQFAGALCVESGDAPLDVTLIGSLPASKPP